MEEDTMVRIQNAYKKYGNSPPVLMGLNMTVPKGTIYGLLGPSGCGKTTLLSSVVSRTHLDFGVITLGVKKKSEIGYMPQDIALFQECTIREIFNFYGTLYNMRPGQIKMRSEQICGMLDLPSSKRFIHTLSGGQQRRVSFAVALFHQPPLLILDEPTVGMDPILSHRIWHHLVKLTTEQRTTIIITTHYIEEAKASHKIGLMRNGVLLIEDSPKNLIERQNCTNLEDAFLALSAKQQEQINSDKTADDYYPRVKANSAPLPIPNKDLFNMGRFIAQLGKNIRWTKRNIGVILFILLLPALQAYFFCAAFGIDPKKENLPIGVVSEELTSIVQRCEDFAYNVTYSTLLECNIPYSFSCEFIKHLGNKLNVILYDELDLAKADVNTNKVWGIIHMTRNFTSALEERIGDGLSTTDLSLDNSVIRIWMDMSNYVISNIIKRNIRDSVESFVKELMSICGIPERVGDIPVLFNDPIFGQRMPVTAHNTAPGFVCSFVFYFTMSFTSGAIMMEKMFGVLERIIVAGVTRFEIILAHLVVQFIMMTIQAFFMMVIMYVIYSNPLVGNIGLTTGMLYGVAFVGIAFGFLLTEIFKEEKMVSYAAIGIILALFMVDGCLWPLEGSHFTIKAWARWFPVVQAIEGYYNITLKGYDITHRTVYLGFVSSALWVLVLGSLSYIIARKKKGS